MGLQFSDCVENIVGREEIACSEQFLLFPQCFQKLSVVGVLDNKKIFLDGKGQERPYSTMLALSLLYLTMIIWESNQSLGKKVVQSTNLKELLESIDRCSGCCDIAEIVLKMWLNTIQLSLLYSVHYSFLRYPITR